MANFPGTTGDDNLIGTSNPTPNTVADTFEPDLGNDAVSGLGGDDTITYAGGADAYDGDDGVDTVVVPEPFDAQRLVDHTGFIPGGFAGTFQGGKTAGSAVSPFGYFYDTGTIGDGNGILAREVERFRFEDFLFDARTSQILPIDPIDPLGLAALQTAEGNVFNGPGPSGLTSVARGIDFTAGATVDDGTLGTPGQLTITEVNGSPVNAGSASVDVPLGDGSRLVVADQGASPGFVEYFPGRGFLESLTGPSYRAFLGETAIDEAVTVTAENASGETVEIPFETGTSFDAFSFDDNFRTSNLNGNDNANRIQGDGGDDYISGGDGQDELDGGVGDDRIFANNAQSTDTDSDTIHGNEGSDALGGGAAGDFITGDSVDIGATGAITFNGLSTGLATSTFPLSGAPLSDDGNDSLYGSDGDDFLVTGNVDSGSVALSTADIYGLADDTAYGGNGDDIVVGADGFDSLFGSADDDSVYGLDGDDNIGGADGNDALVAHGGDDVVSGAAGDDTLFGLADDDTMYAGTGDDSLFGGAGEDVFWIGREDGARDEIADFTRGDDDVINLTGFGLDFSTLDPILNAAGAVASATLAIPNGSGTQDLDLTVTDDTIQNLDQSDFIL